MMTVLIVVTPTTIQYGLTDVVNQYQNIFTHTRVVKKDHTNTITRTKHKTDKTAN